MTLEQLRERMLAATGAEFLACYEQYKQAVQARDRAEALARQAYLIAIRGDIEAAIRQASEE